MANIDPTLDRSEKQTSDKELHKSQAHSESKMESEAEKGQDCPQLSSWKTGSGFRGI